MEGKDQRLDGEYKKRKNAIEKCLQAAVAKGFKWFGVQDGGQCFSSKDAGTRYTKYGKADNCKDGKGGAWANNVYLINSKCVY